MNKIYFHMSKTDVSLRNVYKAFDDVKLRNKKHKIVFQISTDPLHFFFGKKSSKNESRQRSSTRRLSFTHTLQFLHTRHALSVDYSDNNASADDITQVITGLDKGSILAPNTERAITQLNIFDKKWKK